MTFRSQVQLLPDASKVLGGNDSVATITCMLKTCRGCGEAKELAAFPSNGKGGTRSKCKLCWNAYMRPRCKQHYVENRQYYRQRNEELREVVRRIKDQKPCVDCGVAYPYYVMDFDHQRDKVTAVSLMVRDNWPMQDVLEEISKCELVCANCHRERTHARLVSTVAQQG